MVGITLPLAGHGHGNTYRDRAGHLLSAVLLKAQKAGHILKWLLSLTSAWVDLGLFASAFPHWRGGFAGGMRGMVLCALSEQGSEGIRAPTDADQGQLLYSICSWLCLDQ